MTKEEMIAGYVKLSKGIKFFYAYPDVKTGLVYGGYIEHEHLSKMITVESESSDNGSFSKLRVLVGQAKKLVKNPSIICTIEDMKIGKQELKNKFGKSYNNGEIFEYIMYKKNGVGDKWKKDNRPFYQGGDLGKVQLKFGKASLANENCIATGLNKI